MSDELDRLVDAIGHGTVVRPCVSVTKMTILVPLELWEKLSRRIEDDTDKNQKERHP